LDLGIQLVLDGIQVLKVSSLAIDILLYLLVVVVVLDLTHLEPPLKTKQEGGKWWVFLGFSN
jgi:hypothetical protein